MSERQTDQLLVDRVKQGDSVAFDLLVLKISVEGDFFGFSFIGKWSL